MGQLGWWRDADFHDVGTFQPHGGRRVGTKRGVASVHGCAGRHVCDLCHLHEAVVLLSCHWQEQFSGSLAKSDVAVRAVRRLCVLRLPRWDMPTGKHYDPAITGKTQKPSMWDYVEVLKDVRVVVMIFQYSACFGLLSAKVVLHVQCVQPPGTAAISN